MTTKPPGVTGPFDQHPTEVTLTDETIARLATAVAKAVRAAKRSERFVSSGLKFVDPDLQVISSDGYGRRRSDGDGIGPAVLTIEDHDADSASLDDLSQLHDGGREIVDGDVVVKLDLGVVDSQGGHIDSSSVVPGVAPSGDDATVEAPGDTARPDSPRRVVGSNERHAAHAYLVGYLSQVLATSGRDMQGLIESLHSRGRHVEADLLAADQEAVAR